MYVYTIFMTGAYKGWKRALGALELELIEPLASTHVLGTLVLCNSSKCS